jgi:PAS domain S-box-containing protein
VKKAGIVHAKVLVVDDEVVVAEDIRRQLRSLGYTVVGVASSGSDAIRLGAEHRPDLILMDIKLKGSMDGIETARAIQARFNIPVIYLTAFSDEETLARARHTLPLAYLIKPFVRTDLRAAVELALFRHRLAKAADQRGRWLDAVLQAIGDAVITVDPSGRITILNQSAEAVTGWTQGEAIGRPIGDIMILLDPDTRRPVTNPALEAIQTARIAGSGTIASILVEREGTERMVRSNTALIYDPQGLPAGAVLVFRPVP